MLTRQLWLKSLYFTVKVKAHLVKTFKKFWLVNLAPNTHINQCLSKFTPKKEPDYSLFTPIFLFLALFLFNFKKKLLKNKRRKLAQKAKRLLLKYRIFLPKH